MGRRDEKAMDEGDGIPDPAGSEGPLGSLIRGARLEPIRYVERELTRPDGTKLRVKVPVYPPFRLEERPAPKSPPEASKRAATQKKARAESRNASPPCALATSGSSRRRAQPGR